jgi:exosortase/archaeosortase family protein
MDSKETEKSNTHQSKSNTSRIWRFLIIYIVLMGIFWFLIGYRRVQNVFDINGRYTDLIIYVTVKLLGLAGIQSTTHGTIINLPSTSVEVVFGCNGLEAVIIYSIAVLAFPSTWKHKLLGIIFGFVMIQFINVIRILVVIYVAGNFQRIFDIVHVYLAQGLMIAVALGVFLLYLRFIIYGQPKEQAHP